MSVKTGASCSAQCLSTLLATVGSILLPLSKATEKGVCLVGHLQSLTSMKVKWSFPPTVMRGICHGFNALPYLSGVTRNQSALYLLTVIVFVYYNLSLVCLWMSHLAESSCFLKAFFFSLMRSFNFADTQGSSFAYIFNRLVGITESTQKLT